MEARAESWVEEATSPENVWPKAAPFRVAVIGLGAMGRNHLRALRVASGLTTVAVCDPCLRPGDAPQPVYADHRRLLDAERLDAAIIATPTSSHPDIALDCLARGLHLLIEKPVAGASHDARRLAEAAVAADGRVGVGHVERFNPVVRALREELSGQEILSLHVTRVGPFPPRVTDVGVLTDLAVHDIDLIRFLTGKEILQAHVCASRKRHGSHEDNAVLSFELEDHVVAGVTTNWLTPFKKRKIEAATRRAYYEADLMTQELREYSAYQVDQSYVVRPCPVRRQEPLAGELAAFARLVAGHGWGDMATIDDSRRTLEIIGR